MPFGTIYTLRLPLCFDEKNVNDYVPANVSPHTLLN